MERLLYILLCVALLLGTACKPRTDYTHLLTQADSLMEHLPDSALHLLEQIPAHAFTQPAEQAYYALLFTQARDKNYVRQCDDSLIQVAVYYYNKVENLPMRARAHYLWGSVLRDKDEDVHAVEQYLTAAEYAKEAKDMHLLGRIYSQTALLYYRQSLNEKADSIYQMLEQIAIQTKDSILWVDALENRGNISRTKQGEFYTDAEQKLSQALEISQKIQNKRLIYNVTSSLSLLYSNMGEGERALFFAQESLATQKDTSDCYWLFSLLGEAYFHTEQYDSANLYLNKALPTLNYETKSDIYMRLADIAKKRNDIALSLEYERHYSAYQDSARIANQSNAIIAIEKEMIIQKKQRDFEYFSNKYHHVIFIILIVSFILFFFLYQKHNKKKRSLQKSNAQLMKGKKKSEERERILQEKYEKQQNDLQDNKKQIEYLQNIISAQNYNANQVAKLKEEQQKLKAERNAMLHELFCQTKVYEKMKRIIADYKELEKSAEKMTDEDWTELIALIDTNWNNLTLRLQADYHLKTNEIRLCCLLMTDLPPSQIHYLLGCSRDNIYKWADRILEQRMGYPHKSTSLREVLKRLC